MSEISQPQQGPSDWSRETASDDRIDPDVRKILREQAAKGAPPDDPDPEAAGEVLVDEP